MSNALKIALLGYGKMGKTIEEIAVEKGHKIVFRATVDTQDYTHLSGADVAIEFSHPDAGFSNVQRCIEMGIPVVSGTTGWMDKMEKAKGLCDEKQGAFFYASNFSVGVNLFFALNERLSQLMNRFPTYQAELLEIHHTQKKDAPSGTAITLAEGIIQQHEHYTGWSLVPKSADNEIFIDVERVDPTPGTHKITWQSVIDTIEIQHIAHSRTGFATGALMAAEWLVGKTGCFTMRDLLQL